MKTPMILLGLLAVLLIVGIYFSMTPSAEKKEPETPAAQETPSEPVVISPECDEEEDSSTLPLTRCDLPSMTGPAGWSSAVTVREDEISIDMSSNATNEYDAPVANIHVFITPIGTDGNTSLASTTEAYTNGDVYENVTQGDTKVAVATGTRIAADNVLVPENTIHVESIVLEHDGKLYEFTATAPKNEWSTYENAIEDTFASIALN